MVCRLITGSNWVALCGGAALGVFTAFFTGTLASADPGKTYVTKVVQDEPRVLPEENTAFFSKNDRRVRFQLLRLDDSPASLLAGASLTVIDAEGQSTDLTTDSRGVATLPNATPGVHAVVASGSAGHVAIPLVLRERAEDDFRAPTTVQLPLIGINPAEVRRVANSFLAPPSAAGLGADYDDQLISTGEIVQARRYRVSTGPGGRLVGRVYSVMRPGTPSANLAGTNLMVYRGNDLVARAITDEEGRFEFENMRPGTHGLIAAGPAGYAAFSFEVVESGEVVSNTKQETLISTTGADARLVRMNQPGPAGGSLPVMLVPPPMVPFVMDSIRGDAPESELEIGLEPGPLGFAPVGGGGFAGGGPMGGAGGGFGGGAGGGGLGGIGGLLGLAGLGAAVAAVASDDRDRPPVFPRPPVATPANPGPPPFVPGPPF